MKKSAQNGKFRLFAGMTAGAALLSLIFALAFSACPTPTGGGSGGGETLDKTGLEASIAAAGTAKAGVTVSIDNGATVPLGMQWVPYEEQVALEAAILAAEYARLTATSQAVINAAKNTLDTAIQVFNAAKKPGTANPVDTAALAAEIARAEAARAGVQQAAINSDVAFGAKWVTAADWNTFNTAIINANTALSSGNQAVIDAAVTTLNNATTTFNGAKQDGIKMSGFTAAQLTALIADANTAKTGVTASLQNGDDVSPAAYWVSQSALDTLTQAITLAQTANDATRDSLYVSLSQALTQFNGAKQTGTVPDKTALNSAIQAADTVKQGVAQAASKAEAPLGGKWATAAQFAPLDAAYAAALDKALNANAAKTAVDNAKDVLNSAVSTFTGAVDSNGLGERPVSLTITGLASKDFPNGTELLVALNTTAEFAEYLTGAAIPPVYGEAVVNSGQAVVQLYDSSADTPWAGAGPWYAGFGLEDGHGWVSRAAIDFTANPNPIKAFSDFKPYAYTYKPSDFEAELFAATPSMTLDAFFAAMGGGSYAQYLAQIGAHYKLYKNEDMTQEYKGSDIVTIASVAYCAYPLDFGGGPGPGRKKIGEITGTITFTNVPAQKPKVDISAHGKNSAWGTYRNEISLSGISGNGGTVAWTIPLYEENRFTGTKEASFQLYIDYGALGNYSISIEGTKQLNGINANAGSLGTVSLATVTLSGTISVTYEGSPVPYVNISASSQEPGYYGSVQLVSPGANAPWSITMLAPASPTDVSLSVTGTSSKDSHSYLFYENAATVPGVATGSITGITLTLGNFSVGGFPPPLPTELTANTWANGNITTAYREQWFKFTATASTQYIHASLGTASLNVQLYNSAGNTVGSQSYLGSSTSVSRTVTSGQLYYIKVYSFNGGTYQIAFNSGNIPPPIQLPDTAIALTANTWADGTIPATGSKEQWFKFTATASTQYIHASFGTFTGDWLYVQLYDSAGNTVDSQSYLYNNSSISRPVTNAQVYYIKVWPESGSGTYKITFNTSNAAPLFQLPDTAATLTANTWANGTIPATGSKEQWFRFTATADTQYIHASIGTLTSGLYVQLYDSAGAPVERQPGLSSYTVINAQVYYIKVWSYSSSDSGTYQIAFNTSIAPPGSPTLTANIWAAGTIPATGSKEQWFKFTATADTQYIHASFGTLSGDYLSVQLYDSAGAPVDGQSYLYNNSSISKTVTNAQVYYIKVWPSSSSYSGAYQIAFNTSIAPPGSQTLAANTWAAGTIPATGSQVQWFKFTATDTTQYIHASFGTFTGNLYMQLYDSAGAPVETQEFLNRFHPISKTVTNAQVYYIKVSVPAYDNNSGGTYQIAFNSISIPPIASDAATTALPLTANTWANGTIPATGSQTQWFKFTATADTQYIHASFGTLTSGLYVQLYDSAGAPVDGQSYLSSSYGYQLSVSKTVTNGQMYYIKISSGSSETYQIAFNTGSVPPGVSATLTANTWANGTIPATGSQTQWFKFTATASTQYIHASFGTFTGDWLYVQLYDSAGNTVDSQSYLYNNSSISRPVTNAQVYYIKVWPSGSSYSGAYQIAFNTIIVPPGSTTLTANTWADGTIPATGNREQWFKFTATADTQYIYASFGTFTGDYLYVQLYDSAGAPVDDGWSSLHNNSSISKTVTNAQVYYIKVWPSSSSSGAYQIAFNSNSIPPIASDAATTALPLTANTWANGTIPATGNREQWFKFTATADTQYIHASLGTFTGDWLYVQLYDSAGAPVDGQSYLNSGNPVSRPVTNAQVYYIKISSGSSGTYQIAFNTGSVPPGVSATLTANTWANGTIPATGNREQWFKFTATADTQYIHASFGTLTSGLYVQLYDSAGAPVDGQSYLNSGYGYQLSVSKTVTNAQVYYIKVSVSAYDNNSGTYQIAFNTIIVPPGSTTLTANTWANGTIPATGSPEKWFKFTATADTQYIHASFGTFTGFLYVQLYDSTGAPVDGQSILYSSTKSVSKTVTNAQVYYIKVQADYNSGTYQIAFNTGSIPPADD